MGHFERVEQHLSDLQYFVLIHKTFVKITQAGSWIASDPIIKTKLRLGDDYLVKGLPLLKDELARLRLQVENLRARLGETE